MLRQRHRFAEVETLYREILRKLPARQEALRSEVAADLGYAVYSQARYPEVELLRPALAVLRRLPHEVRANTESKLRVSGLQRHRIVFPCIETSQGS